MNKENITIRDPKKTDIDQVLKYINTLSKEKTYILFQGLVMSKKAENAWLKDNIEKIKKGKAVVKFIFYKKEFIGNSVINMGSEKTAKEHVGSFGISIAKKYRGKGYGSMLMGEVLKEAKEKLKGLKIVYLEAFAENTGAIKMYEKKGFVKCGVLPGGVKRKGEFSDEVMMYKVM
jgi:RimJ/RimL family protein N-acetyltransferase